MVAPARWIDIADSLGRLTGRSEGSVHLGDGILLHPRHDVAVEVEGDPDLGVPEPFAGDLGMDAG